MWTLLFLFVVPASLAVPLQRADGQDRSIHVLIVFQSMEGHTRAMAEAVAEGAKSVAGTEVRLRTADAADPVADVTWADAVILGSPVHNANVTPDMQRFINQWPFEGGVLRDKIGAAFVTAGGISAGEELTLVNLLHSMMIFGMIVVGGDEWTSAFGASAITAEVPFSGGARGAITDHFRSKGFRLGARVARLAGRMRGQ
jgi:NAD(P)H dehydrogenase (quinone)